MWNAWTAPPGALPQDYDPWSCEAQCARCGELAQDCHCEDDDMSEQQRIVARTGGLYGALATCHPKLSRNRVWCHKCGHTESVDSGECFRSGWPMHCGETMSIDSPEERRAQKHGEDSHHDIDDRTR